MKTKNIFLRVFKLVLLVFFVGNTGMIQGFFHWKSRMNATKDERNNQYEQAMYDSKRFSQYSIALIENAKQLAVQGKYSPARYFSDYEKILCFLADSIHELRFAYVDQHMFISDLMTQRTISEENSNGDHYQAFSSVRDRALPAIEEARKRIEKKMPDDGSPTFRGVVSWVWNAILWLLRYYLTSLPIAFFLMIYWHFRWRKRVLSGKQLFIDVITFPKLLLRRIFESALDSYTNTELYARGKIKSVRCDESVYGWKDVVEADATSIREDIRELMWNPRELKAYLDANFGVRKISLVTALLILISVRIGIAAETPLVLVGEIATHAALVADDVGDPPDDPPDYNQYAEFSEYWMMECIVVRSYVIHCRERLINSYVPRFDIVPRG